MLLTCTLTGTPQGQILRAKRIEGERDLEFLIKEVKVLREENTRLHEEVASKQQLIQNMKAFHSQVLEHVKQAARAQGKLLGFKKGH